MSSQNIYINDVEQGTIRTWGFSPFLESQCTDSATITHHHNHPPQHSYLPKNLKINHDIPIAIAHPKIQT